MDPQNYILCILYIILLVTHSFTLAQKDFHRKLISVFSLALVTQTITAVLLAIHQLLVVEGKQLADYLGIEPDVLSVIHYIAQWIHITSINFFILFLLIVAKGWPITRRDMPFKYSFAIFWLLCFTADLITFYWSFNSALPEILSTNSNIRNVNSSISIGTNCSIAQKGIMKSSSNSSFTRGMNETQCTNAEQFNSTPRRLSLVLRIVIMLYFLLELRTTMMLEQEQRKLRFYLHFGALSMVWFVHSLIVYVISLRVEFWQSKLILGFSSAADFLAFVVTARLLWPKSTNSLLFRKHKSLQTVAKRVSCNDNISTMDSNSETGDDEEGYDGLEMRDLSKVT